MKTWANITRATNSQVLEWAGAQPWARDMAACNQDAQWHAEGDVWTHTKMVCAELEKLSDWPSSSRRSTQTAPHHGLFTTPASRQQLCSTRKRAARVQPKRACGAKSARRILRELDCDLILREEIVALVRFHGRPPYLLEKAKPEYEIISLSWLVNNRLLYLFALSDTRGRQADEMGKPGKSSPLENACGGAWLFRSPLRICQRPRSISLLSRATQQSSLRATRGI